jgi:hypothetical protein
MLSTALTISVMIPNAKGYEGRTESKDRLTIKKNKQNKNLKKLMYHYYRP